MNLAELEPHSMAMQGSATGFGAEAGAVSPRGYGKLAEIYDRSRPGYPDVMLERLIERTGIVPGDPIAEIGAGTGRFTRQLAARGFRVTAIEPIAEMRARAEPHPNVRWKEGSFEATGLPDCTQRWVVAAQAFHWADAARALPELARILRDDGWLTVLWNVHALARNPTVAWTYRLLRSRIPEYRYVDRGRATRRIASHVFGALGERVQQRLGALAALAGDPGRLSKGVLLQSTGDFGKVTYDEAVHVVPVDGLQYVNLWRSRNRLQTIAGARRFDAFIAEIEHHMADAGIERVDFPYICGAWSARRQPR